MEDEPMSLAEFNRLIDEIETELWGMPISNLEDCEDGYI